MTIAYEENILRILTNHKFTEIPEKSEWNIVGIDEDQARVIAQRHNLDLKILSSNYLPTLRIFRFQNFKRTGLVR